MDYCVVCSSGKWKARTGQTFSIEHFCERKSRAGEPVVGLPQSAWTTLSCAVATDSRVRRTDFFQAHDTLLTLRVAVATAYSHTHLVHLEMAATL